MKKNLFFDDNRLFGKDNLRRDYGNPEFLAEYDDGVCSADFLDLVTDISRAAKPINDFLNYTFEEYGEFPNR